MANNSTSPANHGQHLSQTWSRCVTRTVTATHAFEVTNFSLLDGMGIGKYVESSTFSACGSRDWSIMVYPDGWKEEDMAVYVSVFLNFKRGPVGVRVKFGLSLLNKDGYVSKVLEDTHNFKRHTFWGWRQYREKFMLKPLLLQNNDCFTIRCDLAVIQDPRTEAAASTIVVPPSNLQQHFESMLKDGRGTDVKFSVAGELFPAHRCVLATRSPVFQAELFGPVNDKSTKPIRIDDMEPAIFEALLHFIYTDAISDNASGNVTMQHLLVAADRYGLDRLKAICEDKLCHAIDVESVATTLTLADQHNYVQLKDACIRFIIASHDVLRDVMKTQGFKHLVASCPLLMKEILDKMAGVISNDN